MITARAYETNSSTTDRREALKPIILDVTEALSQKNLPTTLIDVCMRIQKVLGDALGGEDLTVRDSHGALYRWQVDVSFAAAILWNEGYLTSVDTKGSDWRLTGKGDYVPSPTATEKQVAINAADAVRIRASTCPKHFIVLPATGVCDDC